MLYWAQSFDTQHHVSAQRNDTQDNRTCFQFGKNMQMHTDISESKVPNEALSCNLFLRHARATVFDIAKCKIALKSPARSRLPAQLSF